MNLTETKNGTIIYWNKSSAEMFGYEKRGIVGKSYIMLLPRAFTGARPKSMEAVF